MAKVLSQITAIVFSWSLTDSLTQPLIKQLFKMEETCCTLYCTLSLSLGQKNAINHLAFFLTKMLYRMVCIVCVLHEPITVQARQGMELVIFLGRVNATTTLWPST